MGGRLSEPIEDEIQAFPRYSWRNEFDKASKCGFALIEWVFDLYENNPILDNYQIKEIKSLSEKYDVKINSICADYFMKKMLFNVSTFDLEKNLNVLKTLIQKCHNLEIKILEIPFVDSSSIKNINDKKQLVTNLKKILPLVEENDVQLTLETDLPPSSFKDLLVSFEHPNVKANYDTGNSTAMGYDVKKELEEFGPWIANVHIKDRMRDGITMPLGEGDTNFDLFFSNLAKINYKGDLIIQGAREPILKIKPEDTCKKYLEFIKQYLHKYL